MAVRMNRAISQTLTQVLLKNVKGFEWPITCVVRGESFELGQQFKVSRGNQNTIGYVELLSKNGKVLRTFKPTKGTLDIDITEPTVLRIQFRFDDNNGHAEFSFFFFNDDPALFAYRIFEGEAASWNDYDDKGASEIEGVRTSKMMLFSRRRRTGGEMGTGGP